MSKSVTANDGRANPRARLNLGSATLCLASAATAAHAADKDANSVSSVVVTARKPAITTLSQKIQDTPQTINVLPQTLLHQQGVQSLQEALKNVPGITLNSGEGGSHGDSVNLRGFAANDDFFLDGQRDTGFYTRDTFNLESVEVYKGPASTLFGRGSTGGVINQVSKVPVLRPIESGAITFGDNAEVRGTADVNMPINDSAAARVNLMDMRSDVNGRPYALNQRWGVAPSVAFGIGKPTTVTLNYFHQHEDNVPDYGIPFLDHRPAPTPHDAYFGLPSDDRQLATVDIGTAKITHDFGTFKLSETARYGSYWFYTRQTAPHWGATAPADNADPATLLVYRDRPSVDGVISTAMSETQISGTLTTGPLVHNLVASLDLDTENAKFRRYANQMAAIAPTPLLNPDPNEAFPGRQTSISSRPITRTDTVGATLIDTIQYGPHWQVVGGVRVDRFHSSYKDVITHPGTVDNVDYIPNPRASLVFKPTEDQSLYFSYGTSYDPSAENLSLSTKTALLSPEKDETYEVGAKAVVLRGLLSVTGALFETDMTNARVGDPTNPTNPQILAGRQRVRGFELGASGRLTEKLELIAGYTYLDARTLASTDPTQVGKWLPNTGHNQANLWAVYEPDENWQVGLGVNYIDLRAADASGINYVPSYVTWDALLSRKITDNITLQFNGYNLFDKYYFGQAYDSSATENHVVPGGGRTFTLTALFNF